MRHLFALFALLGSATALASPPGDVTTCSDASKILGYTRIQYTYGIPPSPEYPRPDVSVAWTLSGHEVSRTETLSNGESQSTGFPVDYRFDYETYRLIQFIPAAGPADSNTWIYSIELEFSVPVQHPLPASIPVVCTRVEGPPVP